MDNTTTQNVELMAFLYVDDKLSVTQIGERFNLSSGAVRYRLKQYGVVLRSRKEGQRVLGLFSPPDAATLKERTVLAGKVVGV